MISGWIAYWPQTLEPVVARFRAPWLIRRGLSTCYLKLPELSGTPTVIAAEAALAPRQLRAYGISARTLVHSQNTTGSYAPALEITHGTTMVAVTSGEVMSDASLPPPSALSYGEPAWTCQSLAASAGPLPASPRGSVPDILEGRRGTGAGFSEQVIARAQPATAAPSRRSPRTARHTAVTWCCWQWAQSPRLALRCWCKHSSVGSTV